MSKIIDITKALKNKKSKDRYSKYTTRKQKCISEVLKKGHCDCSNCKLQRILVDDVIYFLYEQTVKYSKITGADLHWADLVETLMIAAATLNANLTDKDPNPPPKPK